MSKQQVTKAIIPVAGFGTRMLPATKAIPKEMLPVLDKPIIQYIVEECASAGIEDIIMVTHPSKQAIERHFSEVPELEMSLESKGKNKLLKKVRSTCPKGVNIHYVIQGEAKGLGHAVLCGQDIIGEEPFAVILPDVLIDSERDNLKLMLKAFDESQSSQIMVESVAEKDISKFGIVDVGGYAIRQGQHALMSGTVEKPSADEAPSNLAIVGRYVFTSTIWPILESTPKGVGGEIQLTDAMDELLKHEPMNAYYMYGRSLDCGNKKGYLKAINTFALRHVDYF